MHSQKLKLLLNSVPLLGNHLYYLSYINICIYTSMYVHAYTFIYRVKDRFQFFVHQPFLFCAIQLTCAMTEAGSKSESYHATTTNPMIH